MERALWLKHVWEGGIMKNDQTSFGSKRILIVEDSGETVAVLTNILELMLDQHDIAVAGDGHEGIRMAHEYGPDLILMDLSLPKLDGWEVTRSLKRETRFAQVPILAMTAHAMVGDRESAMEAGCDGYFAKPIEVDEFIRFMRPYLTDR
jgi:two-component system cell cycle response regulator DivK